MIAYREYLSDGYRTNNGKTLAKITVQRMFSVACRILQEQVYGGKLTTNPAEDIRGFKVENETTHTALTLQQARELMHSVDSTIASSNSAPPISLLQRQKQSIWKSGCQGRRTM